MIERQPISYRDRHISDHVGMDEQKETSEGDYEENRQYSKHTLCYGAQRVILHGCTNCYVGVGKFHIACVVGSKINNEFN